MGKRNYRARRDDDAEQNPSVDKHSERGGPGGTERGGLRAIADSDSSGFGADTSRGAAPGKPSGARNGVLVSESDIRGINPISGRVFGSPAGAVRRSLDPAEINPILNHPEVFPTLSTPDIEVFDVTGIMENPYNYVLKVPGGCLIFQQLDPGIFEVHTAFLPGNRGANAVRYAMAACRWMFVRTVCMVILTKIPDFNKQAAVLCQLCGGVKEFERKAVWPKKDGSFADVGFWALRYDDWVRKVDGLVEAGQLFHHRLEDEYTRLGKKMPLHADDEAHDRYVGACVEMIEGGQPEKGIVLYNRWAIFAGYGLAKLIGRDPLLIDIKDALLLVKGDTFKVIKVREQT